MKKKIVRILVLLVCFSLLMSFPAYAADGNAEESLVQPRWTEISVFPCSITRQSGLFSNAHILSSVTTYSSYSKIELTVTVQERSGVSFVDTSRTWSSSGSGYAGVIKDISLPAGNYRIKSVATIYSSSGQYIETVTEYSSDIVI